MKNELNDIDLIIKQKLINSAFSVPEKEWDMLNKHMSVKNFLRFSAGQVNIFYIGAVALLMSFSGIFYAQNLKLKKEKKNLERIIELNSVKNQEVKPEKIESVNEKNSEVNSQASVKSKNYYYNVPENKPEIKAEREQEETKLDQEKQSVTNNSTDLQKDSIEKASKTKKVVKRKVYIKNNPVILKDTIIQHKTGILKN